MAMKNPPHPGISVKHDCLDPLGLSVTAAAKLLGVARQTLNDLVHARRGISPEMAIRLDLAFGGGADTWLRMQTTYDLAKARLTAKLAPLGQLHQPRSIQVHHEHLKLVPSATRHVGRKHDPAIIRCPNRM